MILRMIAQIGARRPGANLPGFYLAIFGSVYGDEVGVGWFGTHIPFSFTAMRADPDKHFLITSLASLYLTNPLSKLEPLMTFNSRPLIGKTKPRFKILAVNCWLLKVSVGDTSGGLDAQVVGGGGLGGLSSKGCEVVAHGFESPIWVFSFSSDAKNTQRIEVAVATSGYWD